MKFGARVDVALGHAEDAMVLLRAMDARIDLVEFETTEDGVESLHVSIESETPIAPRLMLVVTQETPTRTVIELEPVSA